MRGALRTVDSFLLIPELRHNQTLSMAGECECIYENVFSRRIDFPSNRSRAICKEQFGKGMAIVEFCKKMIWEIEQSTVVCLLPLAYLAEMWL